jgi:predicted enzyme related to lactoylglutathione lyase
MKWQMSVVWLPVNDWDRAKAFYGERLGLETRLCDDDLGWAEYSSGFDQVSLCIGKNDGTHSSGGTVVFQVPDLVEAKSELEARGVKFDAAAEVPGVVRLLNFRDPDGNRLQLAQLVY